MDYFPNLIGLQHTKSQLSFHLENYKTTGIFPNSLFIGPKGSGKTAIAIALAKELKNQSGGDRLKLEINCSTIKKLSNFIDEIIIPYVFGGREVTLLFDECCELPRDVSTALLTILNPNDQNKNTLIYNNQNIDFDFTKQTFLFMTSESHKIFHSLEDRLEKFVLEPYNNIDLQQIIKNKIISKKLSVEQSLLDNMGSVVRGNPRQAIKLSNKIISYLKSKRQISLMKSDWEKLKEILDILPLGLSRIELEILKTLKTAPKNLTNLAASLGLSRPSLQRDYELYLLKHNLMQIQSGIRKITTKGITYLEHTRQ